MNKRKLIISLSLVGTLITGGAVSYACIGNSTGEKINAVVAQANKDNKSNDNSIKKTGDVKTEVKAAVNNDSKIDENNKDKAVEETTNKQQVSQNTNNNCPNATIVNNAVAAKPVVKCSNTQTTNNNSNTAVQSNNSSISYWADVESFIFSMVNQERSKAGQATLGLNSQMTTFAREKSKEMIELNYFDHNSPKNGYIQDILSKNGIGYSAVGENIAMVQGEDLSADAMAKKLMDMWMNSPGHRANILSPNFKEIGIGVARQGNLIKATQDFYTK